MIVLVRTDLRNIQRAMEMLASDTDKWPGPSDVGVIANHEIWDLNSPQAGLVATNGGFPNWNGPYIDSVPKDPWGSDYFLDPDYMIGGIVYAVVRSFGPNKARSRHSAFPGYDGSHAFSSYKDKVGLKLDVPLRVEG